MNKLDCFKKSTFTFLMPLIKKESKDYSLTLL